MVERRCGSVLSAKVSAQSPPCSMNASPLATAASWARSRSTSAGTMIGGTLSSTARTFFTWAGSGHSGCAREAEFFHTDQGAHWERPYGWAWLLLLDAELRVWAGEG